MDTKSFIKKALETYPHNSEANYSKVHYSEWFGLVDLICLCGEEYSQQPAQHLRGASGYCPDCVEKLRRKKISRAKLSSTREWLAKVLEKYPQNEDLYDYSLVVYQGLKSKVQIRCLQCDLIFSPSAANHLYRGTGCLDCAANGRKNKPELIIEEWLKSKNLKVIPQERFLLPGHIFDFWLPDYQIILEYDGPSHFSPIYGERVLVDRQRQDSIKDQWCMDNDVTMVRIPYYESLIGALETKLGHITP